MRFLAAYLPSMAVATLLFWPIIMIPVREREFPCLAIWGFGIRLTELILFALFGFMIFSLLDNRKPRDRILISSRQVRNMGAYGLAGLAFLILAFIQGYLSDNRGLLLDIRGMFYVVFVPVFLFFVRSSDQFRKPLKILYITLVILCISNLVTIKFQIFGMVGKYSNLTVLMSLYLFCLSVSFSIYRPKSCLLFYSIAGLALLSCLVTLMKFLILPFSAAIIASLLLIDRNNKAKMAKVGFVFATLLIVFTVLLTKSNLGDWLALNVRSFDTFDDYFFERFLRSGGDASSGRFEIWSQAIREVVESPFIGKGLGREGFYLPTISVLVHEHNLMLWLLRRVGFIGLAMFIVLAIKFFAFAYSVYKKEIDPAKKALLYASLVYFWAYAAIHLVLIMVLTFESAVIFWLNIAIVFLIHREQVMQSRIKNLQAIGLENSKAMSLKKFRQKTQSCFC